MPECSMPSRSSVVWNSDMLTTCVRPSPRSSSVDRLDDDVAGHAVPLEGLHDALGRRDLAVAALEAVHAFGAVLDEPPVAAALDLHALDHELVAAAPPLRDQRGVGHRAPDALARRVEDALDADLAVGRGRDRGRSAGMVVRVVMASPFVRSRNSPSRSKRASSICRYFSIQAALVRPAAAGPSLTGAHPADLLGGDEPRLLERSHVLLHARERHLEPRREVADRGVAAAEALEDAAPSGVGQRREGGVEPG